MKKVLIVLGLALLALLAVVAVRTFLFVAEGVTVEAANSVSINAEDVSGRLVRAIQIPTISQQDTSLVDYASFLQLHALFEELFPRVHATLEKEVVAGYSLLYTWPGSESGLAPVVLTGHMDVVPISDSLAWSQPPFAGEIVDGVIYGRGTIDDKGSVVGILEAVELLLEEAFSPQRTIYLAFGHDEEVGGKEGAGHIASLMKDRGIQPDLVLDEGGFVSYGLVPGVASAVALIGLAEKGSIDIQLSVSEPGGHSSIPTKASNIGILSGAIARVEANPVPARLDGVSGIFFNRVGPHMPLTMRAIFANLWLFEPIVLSQLSNSATTNATIRTTTAPTIFNAGVKSNVLPFSASAIINFRLLPGDSAEDIVNFVQEVVDDERVQVEALPGAREASPVSNSDSPGYRLVEKTIHQIYGQEPLVVAPYLVVAGTDARYYSAISENVYRFQPLRIDPEVGLLFHSPNERVTTEGYAQMVQFYYQLLQNVEVL